MNYKYGIAIPHIDLCHARQVLLPQSIEWTERVPFTAGLCPCAGCVCKALLA